MWKNASTEVKKLKKMGFEAWMMPPPKNSKRQLFSVLVSKKDSAKECELLVTRLKKKGYKQAFIRRFSKSQ